MSENKNWKVGVIGCGNIAATVYLPQSKKIPNVKIMAVCDVSAERAKQVAEQFDIPEFYSDVDKFLAEADVEIVMSVAAIMGRQEINMKVLAAGKHLYSQKPFAPNVDAAQAQIDLANKMGVKMAVAPVHRNRPDICKARMIIDKGMIGHPSLMKLDVSYGGPEYYMYRDTDPSWFYKKGAGALPDLGVHGIDQTIALLGPAKYVSCMAVCSEPQRVVKGGMFDGKTIKSDELPDNYIISLEFEGGTLAVITTNYVEKASMRPSMEIEVFGDKGTLYVEGGIAFEGISPVKVYVDKPEDGIRGWIEPESIEAPFQTEYFQAQVLTDLIDAIEKDKEPRLSPGQARHVIEILDAIPRSVEEGRKIELKTKF